ncbi:MAG: tetratricopeptide repeat protein [Bacteroidota bacterium]
MNGFLRNVTIVLLFIGCSSPGYSQFSFTWNEQAQSIYQSITSLRIPEAKRWLIAEQKKSPQNAAWQFLESHADLYPLFFSEDPSQYQQFIKRSDSRIDNLEKTPSASPYHRYSLGVLHLHKAIAGIRFDKNWEAALAFRKSYSLFKENKKLFPQFVANDFYYGSLTCLLGTVPTNYQWILNLLGMTGDIKEGSDLVLSSIRSNNPHSAMCRNEALLIYPFLVWVFESNVNKTFDFLNDPLYDFKRNHLQAFMAMNIHLNNQRSARALELSQQIERSNDYYDIPFWHFERGYILMQLLRLEESKNEFMQFLSAFKGNFYVKDTYEKLSWIALLQQNSEQAVAYRKKLIEKGSEVTDADKAAHQAALSNSWPNAFLLRARLLSDAGLQDQALQLMRTKREQDFALQKEKTEYAYRMGRIHDLMEQKNEALRYYSSTIALGAELKEYFAARAALQAGLIYEERKDYKNATIQFRKCLNMKNAEFKNALDQKAKAGLLRCKNKA